MSSDFYCDEVLSGNTSVEKVYETENVLAFHHTKPFWEVHIVVIPKRHIASFLTVSDEDEAVFDELVRAVRKVAGDVTASHGAARILTNLGRYQESKHLHFHVNSGQQVRADNPV